MMRALQMGSRWLSEQQRTDGAITDDTDRTFSVWETVNATVALTVSPVASEYSTASERAMNFLAMARRQDGALYHDIARRPDEKDVETSSLYLYLLNRRGKDDQGVRDFILGSQRSDGSFYIWSPVIPEQLRTFPSVTGFALVALSSRIPNGDERIERAFEYLARTQNERGDWGASSYFYSTNYYATWIISRALMLYDRTNSEMARRASRYIAGHQSAEGSFSDDFNNATVSKELTTTLALQSLLMLKADGNIGSLATGIDWLLQRQLSYGNWSGGKFIASFAKNEDIFVTSSAIWLLSEYLSSP
jgi:prenyltransferase beta subunit